MIENNRKMIITMHKKLIRESCEIVGEKLRLVFL